MDFDLSGRSEAVAREAAGVLRQGGAAAPPRLARACRRPARDAALHGRSAAEGARGGPVESRPARTRRRRARHAAFQSRICAAGGNHGPAVLGAGGLQLPGARRAQHDRAAELRDIRAEGALAAAAAGSQDPLGLRHDRTGRRLVRCDQYRHADGPRRRRLRHQRPKMVHHRRGASAMQFPDRDGRDRCRRRPHPPPFLHHRADGCAGRSPGAAAALDGLRGSCRADRRTRFRQCPRARVELCSARRAKVSRSRRSGSGPRGFIIACARSDCANC